MIDKIIKIKNLGIFKDFNGITNNFLTFNIFYGWNGTGKTTLSKLFYGLQKGNNVLDEYKGLEFSIKIDNGIIINEKNYKDNSLNINVFNKNFIDENIDWDNKIEKILLISKSNISLVEKLKNKEIELKELNKLIDDIKENNQKIENKIENSLKKEAKNIKDSFKIIATDNPYYFNYNKTKLEKFLDVNKNDIISGKFLLKEEEKEKIIDLIKPSDKDKINVRKNDLKIDVLQQAEEKINKLLTKNITEGIIERLKKNSDISEWIETGLKIHEKHKSKKCEFCGNDIDVLRIRELQNHFSDELNDLKNKLEKAKKWLEEEILIEKLDIDKNIFYTDLQKDFSTLEKDFNSEVVNINNFVNIWLEKIEEKIKNPAKEIVLLEKLNSSFFDNFNKIVENINKLIEKHNNRVVNYDKQIKENQKKLEFHYGTLFNKNLKYFSLKNEVLENTKVLENKIKNRNELKEEINKLKAKISDVLLGAEEFNKKLAQFIGHNEIKLIFNEEKGGYDIIRTFNNQRAKNLSEGEKTAISFIYFITKLKEKNNLENEIIFLDDPISSFDSNNIFSAYSFIKIELEKVKQLFISTHNFSFFKLIRDWFSKKNNRRKKDGTLKPNLSSFYQIEIEGVNPRKSIIRELSSSLKSYNSEYHFVFSKLYSFKDSVSLDLEKSFEIANLSRKLLESFLSFKFPKSRNDFKVLINKGIKDIQEREKVYIFINKYSHLQNIDFGGDNSIDNQLGEGDKIVSSILKVIEDNDKQHYDELVEIL